MQYVCVRREARRARATIFSLSLHLRNGSSLYIYRVYYYYSNLDDEHFDHVTLT